MIGTLLVICTAVMWIGSGCLYASLYDRRVSRMTKSEQAAEFEATDHLMSRRWVLNGMYITCAILGPLVWLMELADQIQRRWHHFRYHR